jgi:hypothetical protein
LRHCAVSVLIEVRPEQAPTIGVIERFSRSRGEVRTSDKVLDSRLAEEEEKEKVYDQYVYGEASPRKSPRITAVANTGQLMVSYETTARKG